LPEFRVSEAIANEMIEHAQAEYPKECCGFLAGPSGIPRELYRLRNVDPDPVMRYEADSREVKRVFDEIYDRDWDIASVYHSHTHSPAFPSPTDVAKATYPEAVYALVSLADRQHPDLRAFRILEGQISELPVVIETEAASEGV